MDNPSTRDDRDSLATVINPKTDDITIELLFHDETMVGVENVIMPDNP